MVVVVEGLRSDSADAIEWLRCRKASELYPSMAQVLLRMGVGGGRLTKRL